MVRRNESTIFPYAPLNNNIMLLTELVSSSWSWAPGGGIRAGSQPCCHPKVFVPLSESEHIAHGVSRKPWAWAAPLISRYPPIRIILTTDGPDRRFLSYPRTGSNGPPWGLDSSANAYLHDKQFPHRCVVHKIRHQTIPPSLRRCSHKAAGMYMFRMGMPHVERFGWEILDHHER